ncbi:hypothetical protein FPQ18DRAFT_404034 [Pyronema domesticum]|nr:hypothetical protein FPQ18DRAFT_404034 [Pyronema domesticum]
MPHYFSNARTSPSFTIKTHTIHHSASNNGTHPPRFYPEHPIMDKTINIYLHIEIANQPIMPPGYCLRNLLITPTGGSKPQGTLYESSMTMNHLILHGLLINMMGEKEEEYEEDDENDEKESCRKYPHSSAGPTPVDATIQVTPAAKKRKSAPKAVTCLAALVNEAEHGDSATDDEAASIAPSMLRERKWRKNGRVISARPARCVDGQLVIIEDIVAPTNPGAHISTSPTVASNPASEGVLVSPEAPDSATAFDTVAASSTADSPDTATALK